MTSGLEVEVDPYRWVSPLTTFLTLKRQAHCSTFPRQLLPAGGRTARLGSRGSLYYKTVTFVVRYHVTLCFASTTYNAQAGFIRQSDTDRHPKK